MAKKFKDDDFSEELENDNEEFLENLPDELEDDSDNSDSDDGLDIDDDDVDIEIIIEIDEDDLDITESELEVKTEEPDPDDVVLSKHKLEGKHSLKYDSIFKGKKEDPLDEEDGMGYFETHHKEAIEVDRSSN
jgi:hypothetical protein